ncbi:XRE family transcriptional regulator [Actinoplanes auranticolor]|nr:XRE family transcriptional regulator [Actinoplanes auranticolor]
MNVTTTSAVPPDPTGAATPVEFAGRLRALMSVRRRSLDSVAKRSRDAGTPISRATVHNLITAASTPRQDSLVGFLRGCGVPPREQIRWLITFHKVYPEGQRTVRPRPAAGHRAC